MNSTDLHHFLKKLESCGLLKKVEVPVDSELEITEIVNRFYENSILDSSSVPAFLFKNVKGSKFPLTINLLGSEKALELALGNRVEDLGEKLFRAIGEFQHLAPKGKLFSWLWKHKKLLWKFRFAKACMVKNSPVKEVKKSGSEINLNEFPILKCWPEDGGKFITAGLVFTKSPKTGLKNMGIYRLQVLNSKELILHWQIQKGGAFHFWEAESQNQPLEIAIAIGGDPLLWLAGILPLPEGMDEISIASFLAGRKIPMIACETVSLEVPASAEIIIEGIAQPKRRAQEGPFGDHFGHYSHPAPFPVLKIKCITHKKNAIYHAAIVGKPPQEDKVMGEAVTKLFSPLLKTIKPELHDLWAYYETGFHNLLVISVKQRYEKEGIKTALALLGEGQLSLSKCVIVVDENVNARNFLDVLKAIKENFIPKQDFILIPSTAQDTLDFTGPKINRGSKMILDATSSSKLQEHQTITNNNLSSLKPLAQEKINSEKCRNLKSQTNLFKNMDLPLLKTIDPNILDFRIVEETLLVVKVQNEPEGATDKVQKNKGKLLLEKLLKNEELQNFKIIAMVSEDVPLETDHLMLWGIFTRFDCERDLLFSKVTLEGIHPIYLGALGIDATWKENYPHPLSMLPSVKEKVTQRWNDYTIL